MAADDDSVLGRLPRSRPGSRSGKRDSAAAPRRATSARRPARPPSPAGRKAAAGGSGRRGAGGTPSGARAPEQPGRSGNPVEAAARAATDAAGAGLRVASALTREALRRLPRP